MTLNEIEIKIAELEDLRDKTKEQETRHYLDFWGIKVGSKIFYINEHESFDATLIKIKDDGGVRIQKSNGTVMNIPFEGINNYIHPASMKDNYLHTFDKWEPVYYLKDGYVRKGYFGVTPDIEGVKNEQLYKSISDLPIKEENSKDWSEDSLEIAFLHMMAGDMRATPEQALYFRNRLFKK